VFHMLPASHRVAAIMLHVFFLRGEVVESQPPARRGGKRKRAVSTDPESVVLGCCVECHFCFDPKEEHCSSKLATDQDQLYSDM
jgi:hypothetical protein